MLKKITTWAVVILLVIYLWTQPHDAHSAISGLLGVLRTAGTGLANFVNNDL